MERDAVRRLLPPHHLATSSLIGDWNGLTRICSSGSWDRRSLSSGLRTRPRSSSLVLRERNLSASPLVRQRLSLEMLLCDALWDSPSTPSCVTCVSPSQGVHYSTCHGRRESTGQVEVTFRGIPELPRPRLVGCDLWQETHLRTPAVLQVSGLRVCSEALQDLGSLLCLQRPVPHFRVHQRSEGW